MNYRVFFIILVVLFCMGCSKTTVVLLDSEKSQNSVLVSTKKGNSKLDSVGKFVDLKDKEKAPSRVKRMSQEKIKSRFAKALAASPEAPLKYILYFQPNSTALTEASEKSLLDAIASIAERSPCMVDIIGHTDTVGSSELNIKVSLKRANHIKSVLEGKGVEVVSLTAKGYGEEDLQVKTADNVDEAKNRNVEIFIK